MSIYSVAEAKNKLTQLIAAAERGEPVTITRHGRPVVEIRPVAQVPAMPLRGMTPAESVDWLERELAKLNLGPVDADSVGQINEMREADYDPDLARRW